MKHRIIFSASRCTILRSYCITRFTLNTSVIKEFEQFKELTPEEFSQHLDTFNVSYVEKHPRIFKSLYEILDFCRYYCITKIKVVVK